jgi:carbonic anhydrase
MPQRLIEGLRRFQQEHFPRFQEHYQKLVAEGQRPSTLFIGCADSRVVPDRLTSSVPGELFMLRNVGNLVPPFEPDAGFHGTSAGIEFGALILGVKDIVVCGHSHCGAIKALYEPSNPATPHISRWLELAREAQLDAPVSEDVLRRTERRSIVLQVERLMTYPMVRERVEAGDLCLHGWHYVIEDGSVHILDIVSGDFVPLGEQAP